MYIYIIVKIVEKNGFFFGNFYKIWSVGKKGTPKSQFSYASPSEDQEVTSYATVVRKYRLYKYSTPIQSSVF